jgi:hypothetical protein
MRYEDFNAVNLWVIAFCSFAYEYQRFEANSYFHHQCSIKLEDGDRRFSETLIASYQTAPYNNSTNHGSYCIYYLL